MSLDATPGRSLSRRTWLLGLATASPLARAATATARPAVPPLPPDVQRLLRRSGLPLASFGLEIRAVDSREPLVSLHADQPLVLASTAKLVTALAALDLLGPDFRWTTQAYATGPIESGHLLGDLILVGGGDPLLSSSDLRDGLKALRERGLTHIRGDILIDHSAFSLQESDHASTPEPGPDRPHHVRPDAMLMDEGVLQMTVRSTRHGPPIVQTPMPLPGVKLVNNLSREAGCGAQFRWVEGKGKAELVAEGPWSSTCGMRSVPFVPPPEAQLTQRMVAALWRSVGGRLQGRVRDASLKRYQSDGLRLPLVRWDGEPLQPLLLHRSRPLREVIRDINKSSNNLAARHLMLSLAPGFPARAATLSAAQDRVRGWLQQQGFQADDLALDNGSGLSRAERGRPRALVKLLCNALHRRESKTFLASLPVAGVDGTLAHRMEHGSAAGMAFLKTGSLLDARALAGYVRGRSGKVYAVATLLNHPDAAAGRPALDGVIEWLARSG